MTASTNERKSTKPPLSNSSTSRRTINGPTEEGSEQHMHRSKGLLIGFWISTVLFCLQMGFTAYAQLQLPQVAGAFAHMGFPPYFRIELSWAKLAGVVVLLAPLPAGLKEWAYAGFAITLGSALIAHFAVGDGPEKWSWALGTAVLWGFSYGFWRLLPPKPDL